MPNPLPIKKINVRMYRAGTGDFFVLLFKTQNGVSFRMMIDCGCIKGGRSTFQPLIKDVEAHAGKDFDLLVVTHEHADHINGFQTCADLFATFTFKKVWFAWTEQEGDATADEYRKDRSELTKALHLAATRLNGLVETGHYEKVYKNELERELMVEGKKNFIESLAALSELNATPRLGAAGEPLPTMVERFKEYGIIKRRTKVECLDPGDVKSDLPGADGIRFYVLGPPRDSDYLDRTHSDGETYEKRKKPSKIDFAFLAAMGALGEIGKGAVLPFEEKHEAKPRDLKCREAYEAGGDWRKIDADWLYSAGNLAMRYERSINNTSLVLAIQFEDSERVLLFPGDAELGNWESWHDDLKWRVIADGELKEEGVEYLLRNTVFYKVGHHLSQNGTAKGKGIDMMTSPDFTAMATLNFKKINKGWLNTMPSDLLSEDLIRKSEGKFLFSGDCDKILSNIKTNRVTVKKEHEHRLRRLNGKFDGKNYIDWEVEG